MMTGSKVTHVVFRGGLGIVHVRGSKQDVKDKVRSAWSVGDIMVDIEMQVEDGTFTPLTVLVWEFAMIGDDHDVDGSEGKALPGKDTGFVIDAEKVGEVVI